MPRIIDVIDSHTGGEPTRLVVAGFPDLGHGSLLERRMRFHDEFDDWRSAIACEPRGSDPLVGALLTTPVDASCCAGVIFFNNVGYLGMCGHGMIGVVRTLAYLGRISPGIHRIETPVGIISAELHDDLKVTVENVESYRLAANVQVNIPDYGVIHGDIAWGGNWFYITKHLPCPLEFSNIKTLANYTENIRCVLGSSGITGEDAIEIDHIELNADSPNPNVNSRNFVLCPGLAYDRSPCGTGTSAKLACLAADGRLAPKEIWYQESITGSIFESSYIAGKRGIHPQITGVAYITAVTKLLIDTRDPFAWGIR
ncbi:MAG TPA: proline racemase family protein [Gammaproteobacteria bacterium]|nr:proline racemase family protein [Gammaproteobacteria bacterium]